MQKWGAGEEGGWSLGEQGQERPGKGGKQDLKEESQGRNWKTLRQSFVVYLLLIIQPKTCSQQSFITSIYHPLRGKENFIQEKT